MVATARRRRGETPYADAFQNGATSSECSRTRARAESWEACLAIAQAPERAFPRALFWLRMLFGRRRSRWCGVLSELYLPVLIRAPVFRLFALLFHANLAELTQPLNSFQSFNEFFRRKLRDGLRPIAELPKGIVSPVDARVLTVGVIDSANGRVEQVKGATYSVHKFLGLDPVSKARNGSTIHYIVLYLGPGDYHRIHSPCDVEFTHGRHFSGEFFPLRTCLLRSMDDLLCVNERVVLSGEWAFGQMYLVAVAAANVGNIFLDFDSKLRTNRDSPTYCTRDVFSKMYPDGVTLGAGGMVGGFALGSTVVLVLEAPPSFGWSVALGATVRVGQPLGTFL